MRWRLRPLIFFSRIKTTIAACLCGLDEVRVNNADAWLFVAVESFTDTFTQQVIDAQEGTVLVPLLEVVEHRAFGWKVVGEQVPVTPGSILVAYRIQHPS